MPILSGLQEHHISADIAFAVWQYWRATGDEPFLLDAGAEIILETARFWASRATPEEDGLYHIRLVIGPDEYHEGVDDNAYTNVMAQWNLEAALDLAERIESRWPERWDLLAKRLRLSEAELRAWRHAATRIYTGFDPGTRLYEQFKGFFNLEPVDLAAYEPRSSAMDILLGRDRTQRSQVIKQADVVMLLALLWDRFPAEVRAANFHYYERRCGHGSSLSPAIHALVAARLGELPLAEGYLREAASVDLGDTMGNVSGGLHMAALGGLWQAILFGFAGMSYSDDGLAFEPRLPKQWRSLAFPVRWRGSQLRVRIDREAAQMLVRVELGQEVPVSAAGLTRLLKPGEEHSWRLSGERAS